MKNALVTVEKISQLILQPTPFCNLSCSYCYLTKESRSNHVKMTPDLAIKIVKYVYDSGFADEKIMIRWHAGEPLTAGLNFYEDAVNGINDIVPNNYSLIHTIQTNGVSINDSWCSFFKEKNFFVGVSIDGPEFLHNINRKTKSNKGSFSLVMKGIEKLKKHKLSFSAIVILTEKSLDYPDEIFNFFNDLGVSSLGFNIEEQEGANNILKSDKKKYIEKYKIFFERIFLLQKNSTLQIREIEEQNNFIYRKKEIKSAMAEAFRILNVDWLGNFFTFCPELLGTTHPSYGKFLLGNINTLTINDALNTPLFKKIYNDIKLGIEKCKKECDYFFLCGGGAPVNKLYENGTFNSSETNYCKARIKIPVNCIIENHKKGFKH